MSYILDALRKADAERDRGHVPGIHAQPSFGGAAPAARAAGARPWRWAAIALGVLLIAVVAWWLGGGGRSGGGGSSDSASSSSSPGLVSRQAPAALPPVVAGPAPTAALPSSPLAPSPPPPEPIAVVPRTEAARAPQKAIPPAIAPAPNTSAKTSTNGIATAPPAPAATGSKPAATAEKVYSIAELPDDIRRQLPNVAVGGSVYSKTPADRILIINGLVLHEGEVIAPDLVLQQIRLKGALLNFKGYRYTIAF